LHASIDSLARDLRQRVDQIGVKPELNAWAVAQIYLALDGFDLGVPAPGKKLRAFMMASRDSECRCWRETAAMLPHTVTTAWVLYALAQYDEPAEEEIDFVLKTQSERGWWAMFPATTDEKNASTSATAWTALALHHQLERKLVGPARQVKVAEAIRKAAAWLENRVLPDTARWTEYPQATIFEQGEYLSTSALVIHVLRTVAASDEFDARWLQELPQTAPGPLQNDISKGVVSLKKMQIVLDESRQYLLPWMLRTTVESYASGTLPQRARAVLWIEDAFKRPLRASEDLRSEHWTIAETLIALRGVEARLNASSAQNPRKRLSTLERNRARVAASM
jgi:hypothetical protein